VPKTRLEDKDALDVLRLLRAVSTEVLIAGFDRLLNDALSATVTTEAIGMIEALFSRRDAVGSRMAARAASVLEDADTIAISCAILASDLLSGLTRR